MTNATIFGSAAKAYKQARPGYPDALFDWIAAEAPATTAVWDCGTGSGQAAASLAERFDTVFATDISEQQIAEAIRRPNISYLVAPAEASGLADHAVDAVTVATALHWFDFDRYWDEVRRVLRPGGIFTAWTYGFMNTDEETSRLLIKPILDLVQPYWSGGNLLSLRGYPLDEIKFSLKPVHPPNISMNLAWSVDRLIAMIETWSGVRLARAEGGLAGQIDAIEDEARAVFGERIVSLSMPIRTIAGRT
ncbi:MAG: methyltransferase domain-containing protein [Pseudomonadota bacterium]